MLHEEEYGHLCKVMPWLDCVACWEKVLAHAEREEARIAAPAPPALKTEIGRQPLTPASAG